MPPELHVPKKLQKFENFDIFEKFSFCTRRIFFANSASIWPAFNKSKFSSRRVSYLRFQINADSMSISANQMSALAPWEPIRETPVWKPSLYWA